MKVLLRGAAFATVAAGSLIVAGCSGSTAGVSSSGTEEAFSLLYPVTNSAVVVPTKQLAEQYMKENPNVTITLNELPADSYGQTVSTQLNAGNASDVFQTSPGTGQPQSTLTLADADLIAPLDEAATASIPAGSEPQFQLNGKTYGVALGLTFAGTVSNETTAETLGATYPTTWSDLLSECTSLASQGKSLYALAGSAPPNTGLMALVISATRVYADDPTWNEQRGAGKTTFAGTDGWRDTLQAVIDMNAAGCFQKGAEGGGFEAITNGLLQGTSVAAFIPSDSVTDLHQNAPSQTFAVQAIPPTAGGKAFGLAGASFALSLTASSGNQDAAKKFLDWTAGAEGQKVFSDAAGSLPVGGDFTGTAYAPVKDIMAGNDFVPLPNSSWPNPAVYDALGSGVQGLFTGQKTVDEVLEAMDAAWG